MQILLFIWKKFIFIHNIPLYVLSIISESAFEYLKYCYM